MEEAEVIHDLLRFVTAEPEALHEVKHEQAFAHKPGPRKGGDRRVGAPLGGHERQHLAHHGL